MTRRFYPPTQSDLIGTEPAPYRDMHRERIRAHGKHGGPGKWSIEQADFTHPAWLPILMEELGEAAKEINDHRHGVNSHQEFARRLRAELVQVGAMAAAWIDAIDLDEDVIL